MSLLTLLARANDGLPLSASIQDDDQSDLSDFQQRAKKIFRKLSHLSPRRCSIDCDPYVFHYIIEDDVCYLTLCEQSYSPTLAFSYLEAVHEAFNDQHGQEMYKAARPYHFIEFGTEISRIKRNYVENQSRRTTQLKSLNSDLQEVKHIMFENIEAVLQRGELIESLRNCLIGR
jgi:vesicle transport protein SEC22